MPPKIDLNDPAVAELVTLFQSIGLDARKAQEAAGSKHSASLKEIIESNGLATKNLDAKGGNLISLFAGNVQKLGPSERAYGVNAIVDGRLKTTDQVSGARRHRICLCARVNLFT